MALTGMPGIHDARIVEVRWDESHRELCLDLLGGWDVPFRLAITYHRVAADPVNEWAPARIARSPGTVLLYQEFDVTPDGAVEHRLLFHPGHSFILRCADLTWERTDLLVESRPPSLPELPDRFPGGPPTPFLIGHFGALYPRGSRLDWRVPTLPDRRHPAPSRRPQREYLRWRAG
jgi:hypothetical protein